RQTDTLRDGLEPYPTALRVLNWRAFLLREGIEDPIIEQHLYAQTALLRSRLEYHLGGNHLLENACALTIMALHFRQPVWFKEATALLRAQLEEQILTDGGHYERSPVYHQLLTDRLLDVYAVLRDSSWERVPDLTRYVQDKTAAMLNWLVSVTFRDGSVPMVNDAAYGAAPATAEILAKAAPLGFTPAPAALSDSGYRMLTTSRLELFVDVGPVGPDHQPGHAHADTFSFVLHIDGKPVIVDPGISTYQIGERRSWERSTAAHNTVTIAGQSSSEVWSGFRVGRRAQVRIEVDTPHCIKAHHDGYSHLGIRHTRQWTIVNDRMLSINDWVTGDILPKRCHFYFDHCLHLIVGQTRVRLPNAEVSFLSDRPLTLHQSTYEQARGFNQTSPASQVTFDCPAVLTTLVSIYL
ncbi:MAG TPA: alginate lyase family protein, partial [Fibrella sp.]